MPTWTTSAPSSIDTELMALADILPYEQVAVLDIDNGARFETYAIEGEPGQICLNGAAARLVAPGDKVIVITYADYERAELDGVRAPRRARRRAQPGDRRGVGPPRRRAHADRTGVTDRGPGRDPSTSWSWAAAWPGCRPPCGWPDPARRRPPCRSAC